ncbi:MAG: zinc ribbon domain-containing protein [Candidatus Omnitrophica bacterium]|jgi:hypothetical protein|nr:zinc ribbon domain-containing protein [Candidatus Omnitrophota bacterium]
MALIKCKECGAEVSSKAKACPKCGAQVAARPMGCGTFIGVLFFGVIIIAVISSIFSSGTRSGISSRPTNPSSTLAPTLPGSQWLYHQSDDVMGKGTIYQAQVSSSNTVNFDFPYSGAQHGTLTLRTHPRYGEDIIFRIEKGQILCNSYEDCTVLVRFDDDEATNYSARGAADNSTETIFIQNYRRFMEKMLKAKRVRVAVNIYQEGAPVFEFDVSNFDQGKYKPEK